MKRTIPIFLAVALAFAASGARAQTDVGRFISGWPAATKRAAQNLIEKYGKPDQTEPLSLEWDNRGSFKRIIITIKGGPRSLGIVQQAVTYTVPPDGIGFLSLKGCNVIPNAAERELVSAGPSEEVNLLCLNIADEVMHGKRDVAQARRFQSKALDLRAAGKSLPYFEKLLFPNQ